VHPNQPSAALSIKSFVVSLMQGICDEPVRSTELFTKSTNVPTELSSQRTVKPIAVCLNTIVLIAIVVKSQIYSNTIYRRDSGEELANLFTKISFDIICR
jgi:hypothetical protein